MIDSIGTGTVTFKTDCGAPICRNLDLLMATETTMTELTETKWCRIPTESTVRLSRP